MAAGKTQPTDASVDTFISSVADEGRRRDCMKIIDIMRDATGSEPRMWGTSIVGFGSHSYMGAGGRSMDWFVTGFSPRKNDLTLYIMPGVQHFASQLNTLGKHKTGVACLYIRKLSDIDLGVLKSIVTASAATLQNQAT